MSDDKLEKLRKKQPYRFVPVVLSEEKPKLSPAGFHDGAAEERITGRIRCTLETKTPTLVGHYQYTLDEAVHSYPQGNKQKLKEKFWGKLSAGNLFTRGRNSHGRFKSTVEPLFLTDASGCLQKSPVLIPGTSIKGMLRQMIGAMTNAPMERVADNEKERHSPMAGRVFSVRPQLAGSRGRPVEFLTARALTAPRQGEDLTIAWPRQLKHLPEFIDSKLVDNFLRTNASAYGEPDPHGDRDIKPNDNINIEYDSSQKKILSFGKIRLYRWASANSTTELDAYDRETASPRPEVTSPDAEAIANDTGDLTGARLLFGYVDGAEPGQESTSDGSQQALQLGIGTRDHSRLAGRVAINHACEVLADKDTPEKRFLSGAGGKFCVQLPILSSPKPAAFWNYVEPGASEDGSGPINGWGDLPGIGSNAAPLAGRKFYRRWRVDEGDLDIDEEETRCGNQNQIARYVSKVRRQFRFTVRFKDLTKAELGVLLLALAPNEYRSLGVEGSPSGSDDLWHSIGHGRPLGMGGVTIGLDEVEVFDTEELRFDDLLCDQQRDAVTAGISELCHLASLEKLWSVMRPVGESVPNPEYGRPKEHNNVKLDYIRKRYGR